jgi:outer membrane protein TolC
MQSNPVLGSIPTGDATPGVLDLKMEDALDRGLKYNLALTEVGENVRMRRAERLRALSELLPTVNVRPSVTEQQINLAAFGFSGFPGIPSVVGPFTIYDARANLATQVLNLRNLRNYRAAREEVAAAELNGRDLREQVSVVVVGLYLQAISGSARLIAQAEQVVTAEAAYRLAADRRAAGTIPGIDVLRAQVELQTEQQRQIYYEGEFEKQKLNLARAIGLPTGQQFRLADTAPYTPLTGDVTIESTLQQAYEQRSDYKAAAAQVRAAELAKSAARAGRYPSVSLDANYGVIGPALDRMHGTFSVVGAADIPIFQGGRIQADVESADAALRQRKAELEDLRGRIDSEVRTAFMDLRSSSRQVEVAVQTVGLSQQQLQQARDRFAAGVTNNLEVVQAQQAVALAIENHIAALYAFNAAKTVLARARGSAEQSIKEYLRRVQ